MGAALNIVHTDAKKDADERAQGIQQMLNIDEPQMLVIGHAITSNADRRLRDKATAFLRGRACARPVASAVSAG